MVMGANVIKAMNRKDSCELVRFIDLQESVATKLNVNARIKKLDQSALHHLGCFLGNDYIKRAHQNGAVKAKKFIESLVKAQAQSQGNMAVRDLILDVLSREHHYDEEKKTQLLKLWGHAHAMYTHGPVFILKPNNDGISLREVIVDDHDDESFTVSLGSMSVENIDWKIADPGSDNYGRTLLVGWHPLNAFKEQIKLNEDSSEETLSIKFKKCAILDLWSKGGSNIEALPLPIVKGKETYHGSVLDTFSRRLNSFTLDTVRFFLSAHQVNHSQCKEDGVYAHADKICCTVGDFIEPIARVMMRGSAGYVTPELLEPRVQKKDGVLWLHSDDLLVAVRILRIHEVLDDESLNFFLGRETEQEKESNSI